MKDIVFIVSEDVEKQGEYLILLLLDCPKSVDNGAF